MAIPVVSKTRYLGVQISYGLIEEQTVMYRLEQATANFHRIRRWLRCRTIKRETRLAIWRSCVWSSMVYGIFAVGFQQKHIHLLQQTAFRHIRYALLDHSYRTHRTHQEVLASVNWPTPLELLRRQCQTILRTHACRLEHSLPTDVIRTIDWTHLDHLHTMIQTALQEAVDVPIAAPEAPVTTRPLLKCTQCSFATTNLANLKRHYTNIHAKPQMRCIPATYPNMSHTGLPTCPFCMHTFATRPGLQQHLELNRCPARTSQATPVPPSDLAWVMQQPWGPRLLELGSDWHTISEDRELCSQLTSHCVLCGSYVGRIQEHTLHFQHHHPEASKYLPALGHQITAVLEQDGDGNHVCALCHAEYKTQHTCIISSQLAAIHFVTLSLPELHRCMLCVGNPPTLHDLQVHLMWEHGLRTINWNVKRDSVRGDPTCRHCLQEFSSMNGLKQHVQQGRCPSFNIDAEPLGPRIDDILLDSFWSGQLPQVLADPGRRVQLTHTCQQCERSYERSADLMVHLQQSHAELYHRSMNLQRYLIQFLYKEFGCLCAPMVTHETATHVCPLFLQVSIMHVEYRLKLYAQKEMDLPPHAGVLVPGYFEESQVPEMLSPKVPANIKDLLITYLCSHRWKLLWTSMELQQHLRCTCLLCGLGPLSPGSLHNHLLQDHAAVIPLAKLMLQQLLDPLWHMAHNTHTCDGCLLTYCMPDSLRIVSKSLAQEHWNHQCPVALQISVLLTKHKHVEGLRHPGGGDGRGDAGVLSGDCPIPASQTGRQRRRQASQGPRGGDQGRTKTRRRSTAADCTPADSSGVGSRTILGKSETAGLLRFVSQPRGIRSPAGVDSSRPRLEETTPPCPTSPAVPPSENTPGGIEIPDSPPPLAGGETAVDSYGEEGLHPAGWRPAILEMGSEGEMHGAGHQAATTANEEPGTHLDRPSGHGDHRGPSPAIPCPGALDSGVSAEAPGHPLAPAALTESPDHVPAFPEALLQLGLESLGLATQATQPNDEWPGQGITEDGYGGEGLWEDQGEATTDQGLDNQPGLNIVNLLDDIARVRLLPTERYAYANAAFKAMVWAQLCSEEPIQSFWGAREDDLTAWLLSAASSGGDFMLMNQPWSEGLLVKWGADEQPSDVSDFTHSMLTWLRPSNQMAWQRKTEKNQCVATSLGQIPLQLHPTHPADSHYMLQTLIETWCQEEGLDTALIAADPLLCCCLNRNEDLWKARATLRGELLLTSPTQVPFFDQDGAVKYQDYEPIACVLHSGFNENSKYSAILRIKIDGEPHWLLCVDNEPTMEMETLTAEMMQDITLIWLCNTGCYAMPELKPRPVDPVESEQPPPHTDALADMISRS
eukprot:Skav234226  [mRNA]  locus=scaffold1464:222296:226312:+ [translate_table: standard]